MRRTNDEGSRCCPWLYAVIPSESACGGRRGICCCVLLYNHRFMLDLTASQISVLEKIAAREFAIVAFPMYASAVGVKKGNCAALLAPAPHGGMQILGEACFLVNGKLSVRIRQDGADWFVWKDQKLEATPERLKELRRFRAELADLLAAAA